jgi:hypothetical protein
LPFSHCCCHRVVIACYCVATATPLQRSCVATAFRGERGGVRSPERGFLSRGVPLPPERGTGFDLRSQKRGDPLAPRRCCVAIALLSRRYCVAVASLLRCCCFAIALLLLRYCVAVASLSRRYCVAVASLLRCCCFAIALLLRRYRDAVASLSRRYCVAVASLSRRYCVAVASLLRCCCFAIALLLLRYCVAVASLLRCCCVTVASLLRCCCVAFALLLRCCCVAVAYRVAIARCPSSPRPPSPTARQPSRRLSFSLPLLLGHRQARQRSGPAQQLRDARRYFVAIALLLRRYCVASSRPSAAAGPARATYPASASQAIPGPP